MSILEFKELSQSAAPAGENFEGLVRELGRRLDLRPAWTGRGADRGRDLFFTERRKGALGSYEIRWLVSCKDFAQSGRSVSEADVGAVSDKIRQHGAQGFLLATTTLASTGLKSMLDSINTPGSLETQVWDRHELENLLMQDVNTDLIKRFLPSSYIALTRYTSLPMAMRALEVLVPNSIGVKIQKVIDTYHIDNNWLTGERIWPHNRESAQTIDLALAALLERGNTLEAASILIDEFIEFDAFEALLHTLYRFKSDRAQDLCLRLVHARDNNGASFNAFQFYVNRFEPDNYQQISLAAELSSSELHEIYADEITMFIDEHLISNPAPYQAWSDLDALSSHTRLEEVNAYDIVFVASSDKTQIDYSASVRVSAMLSYDRQEMESPMNFPGKISGHIDAQGMFIDDFTVNTDSFYK